MSENRFRHLSSESREAAFVPVAVSAAQLARVQELYRLAAEHARAQLAPPRHLSPTAFSAN